MEKEEFPTITPTEKEQKLFDVLNEAVSKSQCKSILRVAGGWVRDKLLGLESNDIDIAVDNMKAEEFALILKQQNILTQSSKANSAKSDPIKKIKSNPERHKEVETIPIKVLDFKVELVTLRSLSNEPDKIGTPSEDALGRDFTINSLFYNIKDKKVEDFTGRGLNDLKNKLITTCLQPPLLTLNKDPMRSFRAVRFSMRFGYFLSEELKNAIKDSKIHKELEINISKERIAEEVEKILLGKKPLDGFQLLYELNLHSIAFCFETKSEIVWDENNSKQCFQSFLLYRKLFENEKLFTDLKMIAISSFLLPLCKKDSSSNEYLLPLSKYQMLNFWRWNKQDVNTLYLLCTSARNLQEMVLTFESNGTVDKLKSGLLLKEVATLYYHTRQLVMISLIMQSGDEKSPRELFTKFENVLTENGFLSPNPIWEMKPFFKGGEIMELFQIRQGPIIGDIVNAATEFQILNPTESMESCKQFLLTKFSSINQ